MALRTLIGSYLPKGKVQFPIPPPVPAMAFSDIELQVFTSIWDNLPQPVISENPGTFESYGQDYGFILYRKELAGVKDGKLTVTDIHDYATVFLNDKYIGNLDRRAGINSIELPSTNGEKAILEILVEGMGRINFGQNMIDRKGISDSVTLNGKKLLNWQVYNFPVNKKYVWDLRSSGNNLNKPGLFFRSNFVLTRAQGNVGADTYIDMSNYTKGIVWINGHNLGRYWNIGPQKRLYCPAPWLREGMNEILIFDQHQLKAMPVSGKMTLE
jgi:beta-galactosidase